MSRNKNLNGNLYLSTQQPKFMYLTALWKAVANPFWNRLHGFSKSKTFLVMKLTTIFFLAACMQLSAAGYGQRISLSGQNMSLKKVFTEIQKQSGYSFLYFDKDLQNAKNVTIDARNEDLPQVLNQVFENQPLAYTIIEKTIVVKQKSKTSVQINESTTEVQTINVRGTVTDEQGRPIQSVS